MTGRNGRGKGNMDETPHTYKVGMSVSEVFLNPFLSKYLYVQLLILLFPGWLAWAPSSYSIIICLAWSGASYRHDTRDLQHGNVAKNPKKRGRDQSVVCILPKEGKTDGIH